MASPRIFVSSTCYDLNDLRNNIFRFIKGFDYEPVMSEFGDIFYDYDLHVQDACINEISKCQMFILIIGNNYGSNYYKMKSDEKNPKSVTLSEFQKALELKIPKHIFINRMVKYDYDNYKRHLNKKYEEYFSVNEVEVGNVDSMKKDIKRKVDSDYPFNHDSYKHIFRFIDKIDSLVVNNAILTYETTQDVESQLRKQWSNFMYESLVNVAKHKTEGQDLLKLNKIEGKIENIEEILNLAFRKDEDSEGELVMDTSQIVSKMKISDIREAQEVLSTGIDNILFNYEANYQDKRRGRFKEEVTKDKTKEWLESLDHLISTYKWSKTIDFNTLFSNFKTAQFEGDKDILYDSIFNVYSIYANSGSEKDNIASTVTLRLKEVVEIEDASESSEFVAVDNFDDDDLPF